ncbi:MAG: ATP-binding protein, partial [Pseudolabrys sp.]
DAKEFDGVPGKLDRYFSLTTKGENGNGLGLPHVYEFMRRVGGHISVTSEWGRGTTFDLLFPSVEPDGPVAFPAPKPNWI